MRMENWLTGVRAPVVVEIGAGTAIPSVREFSQRIIHEFGGRLIRITPRESSVPTPFDVGIGSGASKRSRRLIWLSGKQPHRALEKDAFAPYTRTSNLFDTNEETV